MQPKESQWICISFCDWLPVLQMKLEGIPKGTGCENKAHTKHKQVLQMQLTNEL